MTITWCLKCQEVEAREQGSSRDLSSVHSPHARGSVVCHPNSRSAASGLCKHLHYNARTHTPRYLHTHRNNKIIFSKKENARKKTHPKVSGAHLGAS